MKKTFKGIMAFLTAMTMTMGAAGAAVHASTPSYPVDVNEEFEGIRGDLDSDGQITMHDAYLLARYLREELSEKLTVKADYNMDGYVNVRDAALIAKDIAKEGGSYDDSADSSYMYRYPVVVNEEFEGIKGDMDGDRQITIRDADVLAEYLYDDVWEKLTVKADYNMDGYVNVRDAALIAKEQGAGETAEGPAEYAEDDYSLEAILSRVSKNFDDPTVEYKLPSLEFEGIKGDINNDGDITARDAAMLCKYLVKGEYEYITAQGDMDDNGVVNVTDVALIQKYILDRAEEAKKAAAEDTTAEYTSEGVKVKDEKFEGVRGDMNGDGEVTLRDSNIICKLLQEHRFDEITAAGDYNEDGVVNVRDAALIVKEIMTSGVYGDKQRIFGDADLSGNVDLADLTTVSKYVLNSKAFPLVNELAFVNADVNYDDEVDSLDMTEIIKMQLCSAAVPE